MGVELLKWDTLYSKNEIDIYLEVGKKNRRIKKCSQFKNRTRSVVFDWNNAASSAKKFSSIKKNRPKETFCIVSLE